MPRWIVPAVAGAAAMALVGTATVAVVQSRDARQAREQVTTLRAEADDLQDRVDRLEDEAERLQARLDDTEAGGDDPLGGLLGGLLGGEGQDGAGLDGLGGLLDGALAGGDVPGAECLLPGGDTEGLLGGLLGGEGQDGAGLDRLLDGLLSGEGGDLEDPQALLDGLLGGEDFDPGDDPPEDPQALVGQVADEVAAMRELSWTDPPEVAFVDDDELRSRLARIMDRDYPVEDAELEGRYLAALGAVPRGTDMGQLRRQLMEDQVAGFYDPETGELVVRTPSGRISPPDRVTLAHELDHALTDQALGLPDLEADRFARDQDALLGALAVVEGDATLLMNQWSLSGLGLGEQLGLATDPSILGAQAAMEDMPAYLGAELMFPYTTGLDHACERWQDDGWSSVDAAYDDLPTTSATVMWPDHPGTVGTPDELPTPDGYEQVHATTFGAAHLRWLLEAPGDDTSAALDDVAARARAWGGGRMTVWYRGDATAVGLSLVDRGTSDDALCATVTDWYAAAFPDSDRQQADGATTFSGGPQAAVVACPGDQVHVGIAPDPRVATGIAS